MRNFPRFVLPALCFSAFCFGQNEPPAAAQATVPPSIEQNVPPPFDRYPLTAESLPQASVPAGKTFSFPMTDSKVFPGTTRTITVYIPAAYDATKAACVYVGLDGLGFHAATVFDNLIAQHAMPVTIGIGIAPGAVPSTQGLQDERFDRSYEFDSRSNRLASFILDEVFPEVEKHMAPDGKPIRLSADRNDHAIGGGSTGAIAAFTAAWERPDAFSRIFSSIGTYVGMRGGEGYYVLVRKTEPKPLRIFMEDGVHDEWPGGPEMGDWWMSNLTMERALTFAGYEVRHVWGAGTHNDSHASAVFPEAMRWLWHDWPAPIKSGTSGNPVLQAILQTGEDWQVQSEQTSAKFIAADEKGELHESEQYPLTFGPPPLHSPYTLNADGDITSDAASHRPKNISFKNARVTAFTIRPGGEIVAAVETATGDGELWLARPSGVKVQLATDLKQPSALAFSPDGMWLFVAQRSSRQGMSYRAHGDGTLDAPAPFYDFYVPAWADESGARAIAMDRDGRAYVATLMGIQVFDRNGRVAAILPLPTNKPVTSVCFGGPDFHTLYAVSNGKIFRRTLRSTGLPPSAPSLVLPDGNPG